MTHRYNASDPINLALNYAYGALEGECRKAINSVGLEPSVGFLHEFADYQTKQSLVYDLQEPFRWIGDVATIEAFKSGLLDIKDFYLWVWGKRTPGLAPGGEFPHSRKPLCRFCLRRVQASLWRWMLAHIRFTTSTTMSSGFPKVSGAEKAPVEGEPLGRRILRQHRRRTQPRHSTTLHPTRTRPNTTLEPRSLLRGSLLDSDKEFKQKINVMKKFLNLTLVPNTTPQIWIGNEFLLGRGLFYDPLFPLNMNMNPIVTMNPSNVSQNNSYYRFMYWTLHGVPSISELYSMNLLLNEIAALLQESLPFIDVSPPLIDPIQLIKALRRFTSYRKSSKQILEVMYSLILTQPKSAEDYYVKRDLGLRSLEYINDIIELSSSMLSTIYSTAPEYDKMTRVQILDLNKENFSDRNIYRFLYSMLMKSINKVKCAIEEYHKNMIETLDRSASILQVTSGLWAIIAAALIFILGQISEFSRTIVLFINRFSNYISIMSKKANYMAIAGLGIVGIAFIVLFFRKCKAHRKSKYEI